MSMQIVITWVSSMYIMLKENLA